MPCGHCDAGTYDPTPLLRGLAMFGACITRQQALFRAPQCKADSGHICAGAKDWIMAMEFPITDDAIRQMLRALGE